MPSFERPYAYTTHCVHSLLFDARDGIGPGQAEHATPEVKYDVCNVVIEVIHLSLFLGLLIDQVAVPMHLSHQSIIPGTPHGIVDLESLGVLGLEGAQVVLGV